MPAAVTGESDSQLFPATQDFGYSADKSSIDLSPTASAVHALSDTLRPVATVASNARTFIMIRTLTKTAVTLLALLSLAGTPAFAQSLEHDYLDSLALIDLLKKRQYRKLDRQLANVQTRYENGEVSDIVVMLAFDALANSDPEHEALLNEWVEEMPESYVARAARGIYLVDVGWSHRGGGYARNTSSQQFRAMRIYHRHALADLVNAVERNPQLVIAYAEIISLSKANSDDEVLEKALADAMAADPRAYSVRKAYFFSLMPRWGGSYQQIDKFTEDTRRHAEANPDLKPLLGFKDYVKAFNYSQRSEYQEAVDHYTRALEHGEKSWYYRLRGTANYRMGEYERAIADLTRAIELWPHYADALVWRGTVYEKLEMYDQALADLTLAARLEPYAYAGQKRLGDVLAKMDRFDEAVKAYDAALLFQPHRGHVWRMKAWYLAYKLKKPQAAADAYMMAAHHTPDRAVYWYDYGYVLHELRDCEMVPVLRTFVNACGDATDGRCDDRHRIWAETTVAHALRHASCPDKAAYPTNHQKRRMATERRNRDLNAWELYKLYVRGVIWVFLEWLGVPH